MLGLRSATKEDSSTVSLLSNACWNNLSCFLNCGSKGTKDWDVLSSFTSSCRRDQVHCRRFCSWGKNSLDFVQVFDFCIVAHHHLCAFPGFCTAENWASGERRWNCLCFRNPRRMHGLWKLNHLWIRHR